MNRLNDSQKKILEHLTEKAEGVCLEDIAHVLGVTKTAAKEHILKLDQYGFIKFTDTRGTVGRPRRIYSLSEAGVEAFPRQYSWLSTSLLEMLAESFGTQASVQLMRDLGEKVAKSVAHRLEGKSKADALAEISAIMNELGYKSYVKQSDIRKGALLEATNCVYHSVAMKHPELCQFDVRFLETASSLDVKLESCIARGDSVCRFCLRQKNSLAT